MNVPLPSFLAESRLELVFFGGKGGVGKTTCASAAALAFARSEPDAQFMLVSTDPAHSLTDSLGDMVPPANLKVVELDARQCMDGFKKKHLNAMRSIAAHGTFLDGEDIDKMLNLSLPGMDELMAALQICAWVREKQFTRIVVDTAPTGHTLKLLSLPEMLHKWLEAVDALLAKHRYMKAMFGRKETQRDEMEAFLFDMTREVDELEVLLRDGNLCRFVPVMLAETMSYNETRALLKELGRDGLSVTDIVVNRIVPPNDCPMCGGIRAGQMRVLKSVRSCKDFSGLDIWTLPLCENEVRGGTELGAFWNDVRPLAIDAVPVKVAAAPVPSVESAEIPSPRDKSLVLFAGKGGVGKTTLSCATALRLVADMPGSEILLFSTDPAHALSSCLDMRIGKKPTRIVPGLTALEIDAGKEFDALKKLYEDELRQMLHSMLPEMELSFDQEAMEKMMDLAPPGLDEVMAMIKVMDLQDRDKYRVMVLDTAPTGHLIRLLEMPELVEQWLKVFFGIFLKYQSIFRLPGITQRFIDMSKSIKRLRTMLADPSQTSLYGVTILTDMACDETQDLVAACRRMGVPVPALFLNLATPLSDCRLCKALTRREDVVRQRFSALFPDLKQTLIFRTGDLRGTDNLRKLGNHLYAHNTG